jgi:hypothetical protein
VQHKRPQHPSGRPVRKTDVRQLGFTRRPSEEPLTPGLRLQANSTNAIGFTADLVNDYRDDD